MNHWLNQLERRFGSWAIPGLIRYLAILFFASCILGLLRPEVAATFDFNLAKIMEGQIWRVLTFILAPSAVAWNLFSVLFAFFGMMLMFLFSDALEAQWGVFRTNLYVFWGVLSALIGVVVLDLFFGGAPPFAGVYLAMSIMFAFATYNPQFRLMLFLVIPTPIWIIATLAGVMLGFGLLFSPLPHALFVLFCLSNFLVVAVPMRFSQSRGERGSMSRQRAFKKAATEEAHFHKCSVCGATDVSHPDAEFRVGQDGEDYCETHLPK